MMFIARQYYLHFLLLSLTLFLLTAGSPSVKFAQNTVATSTPMDVAIIFDQSASRDAANQIKPKRLAQSLFPLFQLNNQNRYFIIGVGTKPSLVLNGSTDANATYKTLVRLASTQPEGATALYDACYSGIEKVTQSAHSKKILLVLSDGLDTVSNKSLSSIDRALIENKVKLYAINVMLPKALAYQKGANALNNLASASGGVVFHPNKPEDLDAIVKGLIARLQE